MRGVTVVLADASRLRAALSLVTAVAALGGRARLFAEAGAVAALRLPLAGADDAVHAAAGLPTLADQYRDATALGVRTILCQSGLHLTGTTPADYPPDVAYGGLVGVLADIGEDRLVAF